MGFIHMMLISMLKYHIIDWFFVVFHTVLILFNMFGWIWKSTRKWNFLTLMLTAFSWFILGIFYGMGYCFLTHWHWNILAKLSILPAEHSYIQYLLRRLLSLQVSQDFAEHMTMIVFVVAIIVSAWLNLRDLFRRRKASKTSERM